jgi:hypothetical protein
VLIALILFLYQDKLNSKYSVPDRLGFITTPTPELEWYQAPAIVTAVVYIFWGTVGITILVILFPWISLDYRLAIAEALTVVNGLSSYILAEFMDQNDWYMAGGMIMVSTVFIVVRNPIWFMVMINKLKSVLGFKGAVKEADFFNDDVYFYYDRNPVVSKQLDTIISTHLALHANENDIAKTVTGNLSGKMTKEKRFKLGKFMIARYKNMHATEEPSDYDIKREIGLAYRAAYDDLDPKYFFHHNWWLSARSGLYLGSMLQPVLSKKANMYLRKIGEEETKRMTPRKQREYYLKRREQRIETDDKNDKELIEDIKKGEENINTG